MKVKNKKVFMYSNLGLHIWQIDTWKSNGTHVPLFQKGVAFITGRLISLANKPDVKLPDEIVLWPPRQEMDNHMYRIYNPRNQCFANIIRCMSPLGSWLNAHSYSGDATWVLGGFMSNIFLDSFYTAGQRSILWIAITGLYGKVEGFCNR